MLEIFSRLNSLSLDPGPTARPVPDSRSNGPARDEQEINSQATSETRLLTESLVAEMSTSSEAPEVAVYHARSVEEKARAGAGSDETKRADFDLSRHHAFLVGGQAYRAPPRRLQYVENDVHNLQQVLLDCGYRVTSIRTYINARLSDFSGDLSAWLKA